MSQHIDTGKTGEDLATAYMQEHGYTILHRNWRHGRYEIDIIAVKDVVLHFIEVKTRRTLLFGHPEESVTPKKMQHILLGAAVYLEQNPQWKRVQYDVLSVTILKNKPVEYFWAEDVYL